MKRAKNMNCRGCGVSLYTPTEYEDVLIQRIQTGYCCTVCMQEDKKKGKGDCSESSKPL